MIETEKERNARTDLCDECKDPEHATCSMNTNCTCCRHTIAHLEDEGGWF